MSKLLQTPSPADPDRRRALIGGAAVAVGLAHSAAVWATVANGQGPTPAPWLDYVCNQVIPATDTVGALAVGAPTFVTVAVAHGLAGSQGTELHTLRAELDQAGGAPFMTLTASARLAALTQVDRDAYAPGHDLRRSSWPTIKLLILLAYYTSEIGGSQELRYELVPGQFDPDVPYHPGDRALSNDWAGVEF